MSNGAAQSSASATYRMLRELGSRSQHSYAAIREPNDLVVVQRFVRTDGGANGTVAGPPDATPLDAEAMALLLRDARCLAKNWHPNVARVRHVDLASKPRCVLSIASDFVDGATLEDLAVPPVPPAQPERSTAREPPLALPVLARIMLDVLVGLHALHGLRDGMNAPLGAIHGELCPANVVVGKDGVARIINVLRRRPVRMRFGSEAVAYAAPEALDVGGTADPRSDVYAVGAMLWEGLTGRRLYAETAPAAVLLRQRESEVAAPALDPCSPFARLPDVAMRALSFDPSLRYRTVAEMAADLRKIAGTKLATGAAVAARVVDLAGERIRMRRAVLEPAASGTRRRASERPIDAVEDTPATLDPEIPIYAAPLVAPGVDPTEHLIAAALATTTAQMRAVAVERAATRRSLPELGTPGDFVIPVDVTETWHEPSPRSRFARSAHFATFAVVALLVLGAMGAFLARRAGRGSGASSAVALPSIVASPPPAAPIAPPLAAETSAPTAARTAPATGSSATARPAPRAAGPAAPTPAPKPKKSVYEPDGL
jgi:hypothetical protein